MVDLIDESNVTLLADDSELSASERTRRLIPYMAFYLPVSELSINKQYATSIPSSSSQASKHILRTNSGNAGIFNSSPMANHHVPIPTAYVHMKMNTMSGAAPPSPPSSISDGVERHYLPPSAAVNYQINAGTGYYDTSSAGGHSLTGAAATAAAAAVKHIGEPDDNNKYSSRVVHLVSVGPPGPSSAAAAAGAAPHPPPLVIRDNDDERKLYATHRPVVNPHKQKTVQYFPPLSSQASPKSSSLRVLDGLASPPKEIIRSRQQQQQQNHAAYHARSKPSKINLTPFTASNTVPGHFVPIVYTPVNSNSNSISNSNVNNIIPNIAETTVDDDTAHIVLYDDENDDINKPYERQTQQTQHRQQIAVEYSASLPPIDVQSLRNHQNYHHRYRQQQQQQQQQHQQPQQQQRHNFKPKLQQQSKQETYFSVTSSTMAGDLTPENTVTLRPSTTPQYIDYLIDEPKQSLDEEQHAYFVVTTPSSSPNSYREESIRVKENYDSNVRTNIYKTKPNFHIQQQQQQQQTIQPKKNVNHPLIRYKNPNARPLPTAVPPPPTPNTVVSLKPTAKFVYVKEEFGQKLVPSQGLFKMKQQAAAGNTHYNNNNYANNAKIPEEQLQKQDLTNQPTLSSQRNEGNQQQQQQQHHSSSTLADPNELPDIRTSSLAEILHKLQESNHLPHTLTPDNIDNSIKTLIHILNNLKNTQTIVANPPQHHELPPQHSLDYDYNSDSREQQQHQQQEHDGIHDLNLLPLHLGANRQPGPSTGRPGIDYPNYADIPQTSFDCSQQRYKGFFGDPETHCQVWHYCDLNGGKASFLCPNGTIFSQIALTCDWWFNVKCATTPQLYVLNERLYKYILPFTPKFPEDYSGPLVDKYLALKFQEMEEKMRLEKEKAEEEEEEEEEEAEKEKDTNASNDNNDDNTDDNNDDEDDDVNNTNTEREDTFTEEAITDHSKVVEKHDTINSLVSEQSSERNLLIDDEVNDISQRDQTMNAFESTTISTMTTTPKPNGELSLSLRPIVVSSTTEPDYGDDIETANEQEKLSDVSTNKIEIRKAEKNRNETVIETPQKKSENDLKVTVEKVEIIEIKSDGTSGHIIPETIMKKSKHN
uniref:Chitin-binding type-2 domain-containing protein n=1 Tax=Glossina brevipalpis TaxID=37001 RepID=A0A1A9W2S5_9MUSC